MKLGALLKYAFAGLAAGMVATPSLGVVPQFFNKKRGLANGVSHIGSIVGSFALPPVWIVLVEHFSARGAFTLFSGIFAQMIVCAALIRPLEFYTRSRIPRDEVLKYPNLLLDSACSEPDRIEMNAMDGSLYVTPNCTDRCDNHLDYDLTKTKSINSSKENQGKMQISEMQYTTETFKETDKLNSDSRIVKTCSDKSSPRDCSLFRNVHYLMFLLTYLVSMIGNQGVYICIPLYLKCRLYWHLIIHIHH